MDKASQTASATAIMYALLVSHLDKAGALSKADIVASLRASADDAQADRGSDIPVFDLRIIRLAAKLIEDEGKPRWTPDVISGGLVEPD